jgi:uncharacterized membrane protein YjgN (DUF898 family)
MNDTQGMAGERRADPDTAFEFDGTWREFLPIALTNLLLTLVTLGIYRFWAKARERRYLWSRTRFIDDNLEWTGTGKEMFIGFLIVFLVLVPIFLGGAFLWQALLIRGQPEAAGLVFFILYGGVFYLIGVAGFRALRYRLSRSWWHGIRGGSEDGGWSYGWKYVWKTLAGLFVLGLLVPWSMTSLWNDRWNEMSFGQNRFEAAADTDGLFGRWLLVYLVPIVGFIVLTAGIAGVMASAGGGEPSGAALGTAFVMGLLVYLAFLIASLSFYAAFYRKVVGATSVAGIHFEFTARTMDWLKLVLGNIGLVIITLGFGLLFLGYRNWSFAVRHMEATGEINLDALLQSRAAATGDAEGLADAFDIGAI